MKDLAWLGVWLALVVVSEFVEDYRVERCVEHGGAWVKVPGCKDDYCDWSKRK